MLKQLNKLVLLATILSFGCAMPGKFDLPSAADPRTAPSTLAMATRATLTSASNLTSQACTAATHLAAGVLGAAYLSASLASQWWSAGAQQPPRARPSFEELHETELRTTGDE